MLSAKAIAKRIRKGKNPSVVDPLCIIPLRARDLRALASSGASSIDLRLGTWFSVLRQARLPCLDIDDKYPASESKLAKKSYVHFGRNFYLHPGSFVLGITLEWLRLPNDLAGAVIGKSSWGRRGLVIATATGVHPGFRGCLTLELANVGELPIAIQPGMCICQLSLYRVDEPDTKNVDKSQHSGHRQPRLGKIELDDTAKLLKRALTGSNRNSK